MKLLWTAAVCATLAGPASAQSIPEMKLPEELDRAFREMMESLKPSLEQSLKLMESFGQIGDPRHYHLPEVLPNGDVILRRREDAPPYSPPAEVEEDQDGKGVRT